MASAVELQQYRRQFWRGVVRDGLSTVAAARRAGVCGPVGRRWFRECGGVAPVDLSEPEGRYLSLSEREEVSRGLAAGLGDAEIAHQLGRHRTTIWRERHRNRPPKRGADGYRAVSAQAAAEARSRRPKRRKLEHEPLRTAVQERLEQRHSPQQIARRLKREFPDDEAMQASHETIYRALFVQGRGSLRRELATCLRTGRAIRRPQRRVDGRSDPDRRIPDKVMISERPAEAADRAVPGHWEGDLILGKANRSAIGTLVERTTRFCMLLHLPGGPADAIAVRDQIVATIGTLPEFLRPLTDLGSGPGAAPAPRDHHRRGPADLLLRSPLALAARQQREHQRTAPPVLPQGHRSLGPHRRGPGLRRRRTQRPTPPNPRLGHPRRSPRRPTLSPRSQRRCCNRSLRPPDLIMERPSSRSAVGQDAPR